MPHVLSNTSGSTSMAMSQRTPSHCPAIFTNSPIIACCNSRVAIIELQRVGPPVKVRVAAVRQHQRPVSGGHSGVVARRASQIGLAARDEVVGVLVDPRVIRGHVVGDEVEHQLQIRARAAARADVRAPRRRPDRDGPCSSGSRSLSRRYRHRVRSGRVSSNSRRHPGFAREICLRRGAGLPDAQKPDPVETLALPGDPMPHQARRPESNCPGRASGTVPSARHAY